MANNFPILSQLSITRLAADPGTTFISAPDHSRLGLVHFLGASQAVPANPEALSAPSAGCSIIS